MGSFKSLALLALLLSLSLVVFADTSNEATHAKDEVKPNEATDAIEPQQGGRGGCRYGCCGSYAFGRCSACCSSPQAADNLQAKDEVKPSEATDTIEPQQGGRGGCRYGCCGSYAFGRCSACCSLSQAANQAKDEVKPNEATDAIEPQQGGRGGCRYGCCGSYAFGRCSACCSRPQAEAEVVEPQQRRVCRYGCCGSYAFGQCSACCPRKMANEDEKTNEEAKP